MFSLAVIAYAWALKFVPISRAQYIAVLQYPLAIFLASMFLGDKVSPVQWFGIALIVCGIVLSVRN
jgi:drug/metabolite transporter (DMT)-like permease